ncbi:50S ribosomal protein L23 [Halarchaeum sp. CBA1220]|uniref:Large ribosomal subunit protein uL23 n=1 Tax=Halarchaeum grantii TaxID=1193105 RepID=A0A830EZV7_9EURY|nr:MULTISPECIES: 50S ribosomal protein L23 [Halarchaeum]QLC32927.1 50S ribosomal protein L23 [Halarchaeum sp. CBA1220]GGL26385.1 50S ribosomal protein L23 [Halarchaeum grantii]
MSVIEYPLVTEKAMNDMDFGNKLQFVVDIDATKTDVREEVASQYDVTVESVNTQVTMDGTKKAIVALSEEDDAQDVASRIGVF